MNNDMTTAFYMIEYIRAKRERRVTATQLRFARHRHRYYLKLQRNADAKTRKKIEHKINKYGYIVRDLERKLLAMQDVLPHLPAEQHIINQAEDAAYTTIIAPKTIPGTPPILSNLFDHIAKTVFHKRR